MFNEYRNYLFDQYHAGREYFIHHPEQLMAIEEYVTTLINDTIVNNYDEIEHDYNEASYIYPLWGAYSPVNRGRDPRGDQIPWIEVGEHAVGAKLNRLISLDYEIIEIGLPSGADDRFILRAPEISRITNGFTDSVFLFLDIKSVGPRDNFDHTVISPYQVSGDGIWERPQDNLMNTTMTAYGSRAQHVFYPAITPIYALTDGTIAPTVHLFVKPVYTMLSLDNPHRDGQPLESIINVCVPNGLLLTVNPNYLRRYPGLFYPGKDDAKKDPLKIRVRVSFEILRNIARWRYSSFG